MSEYIERDAAMIVPVLPKEYRQYQTENLDDAYEQGWLDATGNLKNVPAADVVPVKHGKWISNGIPDSMLSGCSACGFTCGAHSFSYCPKCGARMDLRLK